ncbi:MAG: DUF3575 domain-containing protein [Bacteroidales bacterium]|nr:DUF3575 domain-containing protein [Bacteroidales bacterium]
MLILGIISMILFSGPARPENASRVHENVHETQVYFRWDKSNYEDNYRSNSQAADKVYNLMKDIGTERVDSVIVKAYASPEGAYGHNMDLSRRRAMEFDRAVREKMGLMGADIPITVLPGGEAWEQLRARVEADTVISATAKKRTLALLDDDSVPRDTKKWRMMHFYLGETREEGDVYHWLLLNHYVYLRCLDIKIYYHDAVPYSLEEPQEEVKEEPSPATEEPAAQPDTTAVSPSEAFVPSLELVSPASDNTAKRRFSPVIGISTNLLFDATYIPNYGFTSVPSFSLEYYPARGHWTFGADVDWSHWLHYDTHKFNQIHNISLHTRRYFKSGENGFKGLYLQGALNAAEYGLGWDAHGWEGELLGANLGAGYKINFGRFFIDMGLDVGYFYSRNDPYVWGDDATGWYYYDYVGDPAQFAPRQKGFQWFGPTRAYISIGLDLFNRKR